MTERAPRAEQRLVVRSIGDAGFAVVKALDGVCPLSGPEVAACVYRAPGELFARLPFETAEAMAEQLRRTGLEIELVDADAPFTPGEAELDLALEIGDLARVGELLREVVSLLGIDGKAARKLLCASPCALVGGVSQATAAALARRFNALGATLLSADPRASLFDAYVVASSPHVAARVCDSLQPVGLVQASPLGGSHVADLDWDHAQALWEGTGRRADTLRIFNQSFERFDVVLDACDRAADIAAVLPGLTGMPERVVGRVLERLPVVLLRDAPRDAAADALAALTNAGGTAHAELIALQEFSLDVIACPQVAAAQRVLHWLGDVPPETSEERLRLRRPLEGPFTATQARWIQRELAAVGANVRLAKYTAGAARTTTT